VSQRFEGKICVVTGASSGIGRAIAQALAGEGGRVIGFARRFETTSVPGAPDAGAVLEARLDVSDEAMVADRFAALDRVDVLINAAGDGYFAPFDEASVDDIRTMLDVHVIGTFLCSREALRRMNGSGHVINIGSIAARDTFEGSAGYTAAKMGQLGIGRVLTLEARERGALVTTVMPGAVNTPIWDGREGFDRGKMMQPDDFAGLVLDILARPGLGTAEVTVTPPGGNL